MLGPIPETHISLVKILIQYFDIKAYLLETEIKILSNLWTESYDKDDQILISSTKKKAL